MKRIRAKFIKDNSVKFLSHLDILRTFGRAIRRSGIPIVYSQGFNPHPSMSFGLPLSVGVTSQGEFVDMDVEDNITLDQFIKTINTGLPSGLQVVDASEVDAKSNIMAIIKAAAYNVKIEGDKLENLTQNAQELLKMSQIVVEKETKSGVKEADIKPDIRELKVINSGKNNGELYMNLSAGSVSNLKPEFVVAALKKYCGIQVDDIEVHRVELIY